MIECPTDWYFAFWHPLSCEASSLRYASELRRFLPLIAALPLQHGAGRLLLLHASALPVRLDAALLRLSLERQALPFQTVRLVLEFAFALRLRLVFVARLPYWRELEGHFQSSVV